MVDESAVRSGKNPSQAGRTQPPEKQKLRHLVIDSGAIIAGECLALHQAAEEFWTVSEVLGEIKDTKARYHLASLPFELKVREPDEDSMKAVANFAKLTGDFRALSMPDLKVLALTYMLEFSETRCKSYRKVPSAVVRKQSAKKQACESTEAAVATEEGEEQRGEQLKQALSIEQVKETGVSEPVGASAEKDCDDNCLEEEVDEDDEEEDDDGDASADERLSADEREEDDDGDASTREQGDGMQDEKAEEKAIEELAAEDANSQEEEEEEAETACAEQAVVPEDECEPKDEGDESSSLSEEWEPEVGVEADALEDAGLNVPEEDFPALGQPITTMKAPAGEMSWAKTAWTGGRPKSVPVHDSSKIVIVNKGSRNELLLAGQGGAEAAVEPAQKPSYEALSSSSRILGSVGQEGVSSGGIQDDDGCGWVNHTNLRDSKAMEFSFRGVAAPAAGLDGEQGAKKRRRKSLRKKAGCCTTDYSMQNVMLQMGMPLLSLDGRRINKVRQWIMYCSACFKTTTDMNKLFCPVCGSDTLSRVSSSVDSRTGESKIHLRKGRKNNLRGTKYSLPKPGQGGRFEGDLLLREDQLLTGIWAQKAKRAQKNVNSMFGEHVMESVGLCINKSADIKVGFGKKNPNAMRGRERRGKKKVTKK